ncbi:hypothetical protein GE09DRAFT_976789 [Coniochaeta sp. 2T2.1]|nr:hypothetical protein GE09DRAFT_976789 [Coniochaeta sp. 2T2.1]
MQAQAFAQGQAQGQAQAQAQQAQLGRHPDGLGAVMNQFSSLALPGGHMAPGSALPQHMAAHPTYFPGGEGAIAYTPYGPVPMANIPQVPQVQVPEAYQQAAVAPQFPMPAGFPHMPVPYSVIGPYTPGRPTSYTDRSTDVPALENRRGSYSTTESTPVTPFFGHASDRGNGGARIAVARSTFNTPSPDHAPAQATNNFQKPSPAEDVDIEALLQQEPAIPRAVPAVFTPPQHIKTLEQCLENRIVGNRNVYIRGLHPTTDDDLLLKYSQRFGTVEQSKAIIDTATGACKGFGFAKFSDVRDSEKCIRGFYSLGYEVGFARESFNARLKAEGDESSTNLYLSNLPKRLTEAELNTIFEGYHVLSSKILRDSMGNSRGVGFARFESRDECEDVIKKFHGMAIGEDQMCMQVRYADTPAQKELKRVTAERRQFRTNEYNIGAYGTAEVGIHPSIYAPQPVWRSSGRAPDKPPVSKSADASVAGGSDDEGVTVVDTSAAGILSTKSSPSIKKEMA